MHPSAAQPLTVADILSRMRERWVLALTPVVLGLAASTAYTLLAPPVYVSTASVVVQPLLAEQFGNINLSSVINMSTESQLAASSAVAAKAGEKLALTADAVRSSLSIDSPQGTQVLNIRYRATTPAGAAAGAQTVAESYLAYREGSAQADADRRLVSIADQIDTVNARIADGGGQTSAYQEALRALLTDQRELTSIKATAGGRVITSAVPPLARSAPRPVVDLAIGLAGGGIVGLVLSVLWPRRRQPVSPAELARLVSPTDGGPLADETGDGEQSGAGEASSISHSGSSDGADAPAVSPRQGEPRRTAPVGRSARVARGVPAVRARPSSSAPGPVAGRPNGFASGRGGDSSSSGRSGGASGGSGIISRSVAWFQN